MANITWKDEYNNLLELTGTDRAVNAVREAVTFYCGNHDVRIEAKPEKLSKVDLEDDKEE